MHVQINTDCNSSKKIDSHPAVFVIYCLLPGFSHMPPLQTAKSDCHIARCL